MSKRLRIHPEAADEILAAAEWYERERPGLGRDFESVIHAAVADLTSGLLNGSRIHGRHRNARRIVLTRFPYDLVFLSREDEIVLVAIAHHARRPGYWRHRLR